RSQQNPLKMQDKPSLPTSCWRKQKCGWRRRGTNLSCRSCRATIHHSVGSVGTHDKNLTFPVDCMSLNKGYTHRPGGLAVQVSHTRFPRPTKRVLSRRARRCAHNLAQIVDVQRSTRIST